MSELSKPRPIQYILRISGSDSQESIIEWEATTPFSAIHVGDFLDKGALGIKDFDNDLRVTKIRHLLFETSDHYIHNIHVFTEDVSK